MQAETMAAAGRLAATIAHEINNPLEAITNFVYLARMTPGMPEDAARQLAHADRELARVAQIARKALGFYRETSQEKWFQVHQLVEEVMLLYERKMRDKQITAHVEVDFALRIHVKQGELRQIISNLLANAIDACAPGGAIWLRARSGIAWRTGARRGVRFTLADNGSGMPPEVQRRIFVPFFTTKGNTGTGLGLWVSKTLLEQHGGYLRFHSRQGARPGTVMSFFLPATAEIYELPRCA